MKPDFSLNTDEENLAAILLGKRSVEIVGLNDPVLTDHQVRVRLHVSAICGTQLGEWNQTRGPDPYLPHCFGHEAVGRVLEIGRSVEDLAVGDRVVVSWMKTPAKSDGPPKFVQASSGTVVNFGECCTFLRRGVFPRANPVIDEFLQVRIESKIHVKPPDWINTVALQHKIVCSRSGPTETNATGNPRIAPSRST